MKSNIINYDHQLIPGFIFPLREIHETKVLGASMAKKLITQGNLEYIKIGSKTHISRFELVRYFSEITKNAETKISIKSYKEQFPSAFKFSLAELQSMKILKISMAKKLITSGEIVCVTTGNKLHITRTALIEYFEKNTHRKASK